MRLLRLFKREPKPIQTTVSYVDKMVFVYFYKDGQCIASTQLFMPEPNSKDMEKFVNLVELMNFN